MFDSDLHKAVDPKKPEKTGNDREAFTNLRRYQRARDAGHTDYVKDSVKFENFYAGDQWSKNDLAKLEEQGRPAVTINKVLTTVNTMSGEQRSRRVDLQFKATKDATEESAHAVTKLSMAVWDANNGDWLESEMYDDGLIRERGYLDLRMDFDTNVLGEISIMKDDSTEIVLSPDARSYDPKDWPEVFKTRWMSLDDIEEEFGLEKRKEIKNHGYSGDHHGVDHYRFERNTFGSAYDSTTVADLSDDELSDVKEVRVIERQHYRLAKIFCFVNPTTGEMRELPPGTKEEEAKALAERYGVLVHRKTKKRLRVTISVDSVLLYDDWSIYRTITIVPFFPYFRPGRPFGPIRNLVSPQEVYNKTRSQELHIVNTTANSGWVVEKGALSNMDADELASYGSKTGLVIETNPGKRPPEKIKPNQIPTGLDRISSKTSFDIKEVSGVNDAMLGFESAEVSGVALEKKDARGQVQLNVINDNLRRTRQILGRKILELIKDFYTEERIIQLTDESKPDEEQQEMVINQQQPDGTVVNDVTKGDFDVVVSTMPARDTYDDVQFAEAINMRSAGIGIPDHRIVSYSHLRDKGDIVAEMKDMQGLTPPTPEEQELAAFQQQINMATAQLNVAKLEAEVADIQMRATLNQAKAISESEKTELEHSKLELQAVLEEKQMELRKALSVLSNIGKLDAIETQGQMNIASNLINQQRGNS